MKVLFSGRYDENVLDRLRKSWEVVYLPTDPAKFRKSEDEVIALLQGVDVFVVEADEVTAKVLDACPQLKAIIPTRGSPVNIDVKAATAAGVLVCNTPGRNDRAVAELCVMLMTMVARNVVPAMEALRSGKWHTAPRGWVYLTYQGIELEGRTAGLVGLGAVGRQVAKRLQGYEMKVLAYDPYLPQSVADTVGAQLVPLETLLRESDFVSMHVHTTPETQNMIGAEQFALMKPTAYFINTGRPGSVVEEAMLDALRTKRIAGGAFDVFHREPLAPDDPIMSLSNVVLLPHIGGATYDVIRHQSVGAEANLAALAKGELPPFVFNRDVLQSPGLRMVLSKG